MLFKNKSNVSNQTFYFIWTGPMLQLPIKKRKFSPRNFVILLLVFVWGCSQEESLPTAQRGAIVEFQERGALTKS
jgi:hypothetical protein